nr:receptor-like protein kinase [Arachis hypogaea]
MVLSKYIKNGSLHDILHEKYPLPPLNWSIRLNIAVGIAHGLKYLHYDHTTPIVHRDIKPHNILLNDQMKPLISDFCTSFYRNLAEHSYCQSHSWKKLLTYVVGTAGYIAPENAYVIVQSKKSDVYSYGEVVDLDIANAFPNSRVLARQVTEVLLLALRCTKRKPRERPTMKDITSFYQKNIFKLSCDDVDMVNENIVNVNEPQDSNGFIWWWQDLSQSEDSLVDWNVMATTKTVVDGFIVKLIGNGKIYTEQTQYMYQQKSLKSQLKSCFIAPIKDPSSCVIVCNNEVNDR